MRACYNRRVDNPEYNRLTFCLLGVASPSNLIEDKQRTPFNIGQAISLKGFQLNEVEPLIGGLQGKFSEPRVMMEEILDWTGGQPFLTQKLCQFMLDELEQENLRTVEEVVKSRIIESWESQDEPEHLRTIRTRILRDEKRAAYLLELYQQIWSSENQDEIVDPPNPSYEAGLESSHVMDPPNPPYEGGLESSQITADNTIEQSELLLSGLVARREGKLRVYNRIYQDIFNQNWVENELKNLRPYSESFKFWVASGGKDESRLLRGKALAGAEKWARDKNLSYQDKQFLAASREKEIQEKIAVQEKEAIEKRNQVLSEANKKANRRIRSGTVVLTLALLGAVGFGLFAAVEGKKALEAQQNAKLAKQESQQAIKKAQQEKEKAQQAKEKAIEIIEKLQRPQSNSNLVNQQARIVSLRNNEFAWLKTSLKDDYLNEIEDILSSEKWLLADKKTSELMLYLTNRKFQGDLNIASLENLSCSDLKKIDELWVNKSKKRFGFSIQKKSWLKKDHQIEIQDPIITLITGLPSDPSLKLWKYSISDETPYYWNYVNSVGSSGFLSPTSIPTTELCTLSEPGLEVGDKNPE
ncbi:MAG: GUN4 domain-containing protein, partial [Cyanobacteria bacterium J06639_18]